MCPGNSESTVSGLTVCPCVDGYYRAEGEEDRECTRKTCFKYSKNVGGSSASVIMSYFHICQVMSKCITHLREATVNITI